MILDFLLGTFIGATLVGSSVQRTLSVGDGQVGMTFVTSIINSAAYFFSVYFIAKNNIPAYMGTCLGSTAIVMYMAQRNKDVKDVYKTK